MNQFKPTKILYHPDRIRMWHAIHGQVVYPIHAKVDPTNACNHECPDCIFKGLLATNSNSLPGDVMLRLMKEFAEIRLKAITFSGGGEPLVNQATPQAMIAARSLGIEVSLITNGVLLKGLIGETLMRICTWIRVSLDAAHTAQHMITHGAKKEDFVQIVENLSAMAEFKRRVRVKCTLGAGYLTAARTLDGIYDFARLCSHTGIDYCQYRPYHEAEILGEGGGPIWAKIFSEIKKARHDFTRDDFKVLWTESQFHDVLHKNWGRIYTRCHAHAFETAVGATGDVFFCCAYKEDPNLVLGNIKTQSFKEIWQGEKRIELYHTVDTHKCIPLCQLNQANKSLQLFLEGKPLPTDDPPDHVNFI